MRRAISIETTIAKSLRLSDAMEAYDAACKKLLAEKRILAWIMKNCIREYQKLEIEDIAENYIEGKPQIAEVPVLPDETNAPRIHGIGTEDTSLYEGTVTYDVRFFAILPGSGEGVHLILNIEAQNDFYPGYPLIKRGIYYCCRMISAQYGTEFTDSHYEKIKKVYSIWICVNPPQNRQNTITGYSIAEKNVIGGAHEEMEHYDLLAAVMVCLGKTDELPQKGVLRLLGTLFSSNMSYRQKQRILQEDFDIQMTETLERKVILVCNLSKGLVEKGIEQGITRGILASLKNLMSNMGWTAEQSMAALNVPKTEWEGYLSMME